MKSKSSSSSLFLCVFFVFFFWYSLTSFPYMPTIPNLDTNNTLSLLQKQTKICFHSSWLNMLYKLKLIVGWCTTTDWIWFLFYSPLFRIDFFFQRNWIEWLRVDRFTSNPFPQSVFININATYSRLQNVTVRHAQSINSTIIIIIIITDAWLWCIVQAIMVCNRFKTNM